MKSGHTSSLHQPCQQTAFGLTTRSDHSRPCRHFRQPTKPKTHLGHLPVSPADGLWAHHPLRSPSAMTDFRQPMEPGQTSGICQPHQLTAFGLTPRSGHFRQRQPSRNQPTVQTHFGHTPPICPPPTGHSSMLPPAAIAAAPGKFDAPSLIRRTSPVMTNDRVSPPVLIFGQNATIMVPPAADPYPAGHTAALPVSVYVSLPQHPDHLFHPTPNAKTRETQGLAGFGPGAFPPLTFLLCHK